MAHEKFLTIILIAVTIYVNPRGQQYTVTLLEVDHLTTIRRRKIVHRRAIHSYRDK